MSYYRNTLNCILTFQESDTEALSYTFKMTQVALG